MRTCICLACYVPPHEATLRLARRLALQNDWTLIVARHPAPEVFDQMRKRAADGSFERIVWLHPKLDATVEQIEVLVQVHETTGASVVSGITSQWEWACLGMFKPNFTPRGSGKWTVAGESSGVIEAEDCTLEVAVTKVEHGEDVLIDTRVLCGMWAEHPFYPQHATNISEGEP